MNKYLVQTTTGDEAGSGSDANVYINLFGTLGDSGKRYLKNNREGGNAFETGKVDTFVVEAVELGRLETIIIGHDSSGSDPGWLVEKITVMESDDAEKRYLFPCGSWLKNENNTEPAELELYMDRMEKVEMVSSDLTVNGKQENKTQEQSQEGETKGEQEEKEGEGESEGDTGDQQQTEDQGETEDKEDKEGGDNDQQTDGEKGESNQDGPEIETDNEGKEEEKDGKTEEENKKDDENKVENNEDNDGKTDESKPEDTPKKEEND